MKAAHTPGPWELAKFEMPHGTEICIKESSLKSASGGWQFADRICTIGNYADNEANARLIAAAPEMLEALQYVVKWHREHDSGEGELFGLNFVTTAIAAIRKATGN